MIRTVNLNLITLSAFFPLRKAVKDMKAPEFDKFVIEKLDGI